MMGSVVMEDGWVVSVPHDQAKLYAAAPVVGDATCVFVAMFEIDGGLIDIVAEREEQNPPIGFM
jgi:hypothetical protein